jgi:predicted nucleic acid-binding protein
VIFVDSNVPMYLVGADDAHRLASERLLQTCVERSERLVCDAEVLQEILHRYISIGRRNAIQPAFDAVRRVVDDVLPVELADVERAKLVALGTERLSARDALHLAVMERHGVTRIASFDRGFDGYPGVTRLS